MMKEIEVRHYGKHIDKLYINNNYIGYIWMDVSGDYFFKSDENLGEQLILKVADILKAKRIEFENHYKEYERKNL